MASILEQYENELQTGGNLPSSRQSLSDEPVSCFLFSASLFRFSIGLFARFETFHTSNKTAKLVLHWTTLS